MQNADHSSCFVDSRSWVRDKSFTLFLPDKLRMSTADASHVCRRPSTEHTHNRKKDLSYSLLLLLSTAYDRWPSHSLSPSLVSHHSERAIWVDPSRLSVPLCSQENENEILCLRIFSDWILSLMVKVHVVAAPRSPRCIACEKKSEIRVCEHNNDPEKNNYFCIENTASIEAVDGISLHMVTECIGTIILCTWLGSAIESPTRLFSSSSESQ